MGISLKTHKRLWSSAGRVCAFPDCDQDLLLPTEGEEDEVVVGKECHIVGRSDDGPRAPKTLTDEESQRWKHLVDDRDGYANLVLMCGVHHDLIDGDVAAFPVARLVRIKADHEREVSRHRPKQDQKEAEIELRYAAIVDTWERRIDIDAWDGRMSGLVANHSISEATLKDLVELRDWLLRRVWPRTLPELEAALQNFRFIAQDLEVAIAEHESRRAGKVFVGRPDNSVWYPDDDYKRLSAQWEYSQDLVADLTIELTRAVNLVSDRVREELWPSHRLDEGYATIGLGLNWNLSFETLRPLYAPGTTGSPYPGLRDFVTERATRDYAIGEGLPPHGGRIPGQWRPPSVNE